MALLNDGMISLDFEQDFEPSSHRFIPRLSNAEKGIIPKSVLRIFSSDTCSTPENAPIFRSNSDFFWMNEKIRDISSGVADRTFIAQFEIASELPSHSPPKTGDLLPQKEDTEERFAIATFRLN